MLSRFFALLLLPTALSAQQIERGSPPCEPEALQAVIDGVATGEPKSLYLLARHLSTGVCMPGDGDRALALYRDAADRKYPPAFYNLGMFAAGNNAFGEAERLFQSGAQLGHRGSELQLGILYMLAPAPVGNEVNAYAWLSLLSRRNEAESSEAANVRTRVGKRMSAEAIDRANALADALYATHGETEAFVDSGN